MTADYLITGAKGQLGRSLLRAVEKRGAQAVGAAHAELAVEDCAAVRSLLHKLRPRAVIHAGAWTDVDGCEREPARAQSCNADGTAHVAEACAEIGAKLVYVSTDFVFDGRKTEPYRPADAPHPISAYGRSKLGGEVAVLAHSRPDFWVVRSSWVFGPGGKNFPRAIVARARAGEPLRVVADQRGRPTMTDDLAEALLDLAESKAPAGIYHAANEGECTWHQFAREILDGVGLERVSLAAISSAELDRPAKRPAYSVLDCRELAVVRGRELPEYRDALRRYLAEDPL